MSKFEPLKIEADVLSFWKKNKIYDKARKKGKRDFYFLDGPPYTSGKVHLGTAWNKSLKDMIQRYKRMKGFKVWDRAGYDCHGMPIELAVERKLKLTKDDIPKYGISKFVKACREFAVNNQKIMNEDFHRLGVWMDFENAYMTLSNEWIEGEWWLVKKAYENKRLYEGEKTMHWCASCETALAKHELEYKNVTDNSIFVKLPVVGKKDEFLIIWTTTPWTIPFNLGVMVNPDLDYVKAKVDEEVWIVAKGLAGGVITHVADKKLEIIEEFKGSELEGVEYEHPFADEIDYKELKEKSKKVHTVVMSKEYVNLSAGTGLVHMAPGWGPEDYEVGAREKIPPFNNLTEGGVFPKQMGKFAGLKAKKDDAKFIEALKDKGALIETTKVEHDYAHCWRCKEPVIFRTTKQWFFKIEDLKEEMRSLNKKICWIPEHAGSSAYDAWLDNLRDNGITRQRYWGCPLPIWKCSDCGEFTVIGSLKELKGLAKDIPEDLHLPFIDRVVIPCKCGKYKKRIPDILDVWIDAGSASWNCLDYPATDKDFKRLFPADFILEGADQIRGWFNLLFVASMVSMDKPSFKAVYMHGMINDALGRKMSKSEGNYILPEEVISKYGADTFRYYAIGGAAPAMDLNYNFDDLKVKSRNLSVLWNLQNFIIDMANALKENPVKLKVNKFDLEEKYILSKKNSIIKRITEAFNDFKLNETPWIAEELLLELSRTYLQLTREKAAGKDAKTVLHVAYDVLMSLLKIMAPIIPFTTEAIYLNLKKEFGLKEDSVHLLSWPDYDEEKIDASLEHNMILSGLVIQSALSLREKAQLGLRWPVKEIAVVSKEEGTVKAVEELREIIKKQTNSKDISVLQELPGIKVNVKFDFAKIAPDFKEKTPKIIAKLGSESAEAILTNIEKKGKHVLKIDKEEVDIVKEYLIVTREIPAPYLEVEFRHGFVYLNTERNDSLEGEGYAREVMRRVQALRKTAGLKKEDSIVLMLKVDDELKGMLSEWESAIQEKTGASNLRIGEKPAKKHEFSSKEKVKGKEFEIYFDKV